MRKSRFFVHSPQKDVGKDKGPEALEPAYDCWPLPHVAGFPVLGVLSASKTSGQSSQDSHFVRLVSHYPPCDGNRPALTCFQSTRRSHAVGTNPGSISIPLARAVNETWPSP